VKDTNDVDVKQMLRRVRGKATAGTITAGDWHALAAADPAVARKELAGYLRSYDVASDVNPYAKGPRRSGVVIGFVVGMLLTVLTWAVMPELRSALKDDLPWFANLATASMFTATFFSIVGIYIGGRLSQPAGRDTPRESSFDDMLQRFERLQRELHRA